MSAQPQSSPSPIKPCVTPEEYLAVEREAEFKHEYYQDEVYAMAGASNGHTLIISNLVITIGNQIRDRDCIVRASDMRLQTSAAGLYSYPDVSVVCGTSEFHSDAHLDTLLNPMVLIEVISKSTGKNDRGSKFTFYRSIPSLQYYLLVETKEMEVLVYTRMEAEKWMFEAFVGPAAVVPLPLLPLELSLAEVYRKVPLPNATPAPEGA